MSVTVVVKPFVLLSLNMKILLVFALSFLLNIFVFSLGGVYLHHGGASPAGNAPSRTLDSCSNLSSGNIYFKNTFKPVLKARQIFH
jgi:hypothetical protein